MQTRWAGTISPLDGTGVLAYLRQMPSRRPAQRLGLTVATEDGRLLSAATVQRVLAATSSFFDWAIAAEQYTAGDNPMQRRVDHALGRVPERLSRSSARRVGSNLCGARCGCGCRCACHGRCRARTLMRCWLA